MTKQPKITGLTKAEVRERRHHGLVNETVQAPSRTIKQIVIGNVFTYFNFVFLILAIILIAVNSWRDITFLPLIIANTLIGIFQEIRSKLTLDKMFILNAPTARVIRDGNEREISAEWLVLDDICVFRAGNQIPADAEVVAGSAAVNESLLTGESDDIHKEKGDQLLSGSFIVSGECYARLTKVGADSYINKLTLEAKKEKRKEQSEIIRSLNRIVTFAGVAIIPIGIILFCQQYFGSWDVGVDDFTRAQKSVQSAVAAILGLIPEGLFLLSSVALAISAMKLARNKVLPQDMKSIETLARVNVLCVDKTGTITDSYMKIASLEMPHGAKMSYDKVFQIISDFATAQAADNITMQAVKDYFDKPSDEVDIKSVAGFSPEFKYSGVNFAKKSYVMGAPEFVLRNDYKKYQKEIEGYNMRGYRVMVFCEYGDSADGRALHAKTTLLGLILLTNPIRETAPATFKYFADQGVEIKVISGDAPMTVSEVAKKADIKGAENYVDASTLKTDEDIAQAMRKYSVFGRVTPDQKRRFVKALQADGNIVAMTGDGVNDILALRDADCSIAMASGSDAAVQASQLVLLESDFSKMPQVVAEGRQVVNNLERSGSLFLVKNVFSLLTSILAIIFSINYPLVPAQISLISLFTIGMPAFLLSQLPNTDLIKGRFVYNILFRAVPGGLADVIMVAAMTVIGTFVGFGETDVSTCCAILMMVVGLVMVYRAARPLNPIKWGIWGACILGLILAFMIMPEFFSLSYTSLYCLGICAGLAMTTPLIVQYTTRFTKWLFKKIDLLIPKVDALIPKVDVKIEELKARMTRK